MEFNYPHMKNFGYDYTDILALLKLRNYAAYRLKKGKLTHFDKAEAGLLVDEIFFIQESEAAALKLDYN